MASDQTTFFLAFAAVFGLIASYLWRLDRRAHRLEARLEAMGGTTNGKNGPTKGDSEE